MTDLGNNCKTTIEHDTKKLKSSLTFWSPLNDNFALPDKISKCTWHTGVDRSANPHNTVER